MHTASDLRKSKNDQNEAAFESEDAVSDIISRTRQRKRKTRTQVYRNIKQMNSPLNKTSMPDEILFKFNSTNEDFESTKRLFLVQLPTKNSSMQLISTERYFDHSPREQIKVRKSH